MGILALGLAAFTGFFMHAAKADDFSLLVNGKAIHLKAPAGKNLNEKNWGLGVQYEWAPVNTHWIPFATASGFIDSNKNPSYYAGGGALRRFQVDNLHFDIGAIGFIMTRKAYKQDKPFLGVLPAFSIGTERVAVNMTYIPKVEPKAVALVFFQLKIKLKSF
ncbi:MAG: hypothetical protein HY081_09395 [Gammaproteobacteria bacterium]|nr:hypothetical protein [Gammaproteobacteria bacterium]